MAQPSTETPILIWVVYDHPTDWPDHYVARLWKGEHPTGDMVLAFDLSVIRGHLADKGLTCLGRRPEDDANILETWL